MAGDGGDEIEVVVDVQHESGQLRRGRNQEVRHSRGAVSDPVREQCLALEGRRWTTGDPGNDHLVALDRRLVPSSPHGRRAAGRRRTSG